MRSPASRWPEMHTYTAEWKLPVAASGSEACRLAAEEPWRIFMARRLRCWLLLE
jgi:hypothetical protein